jgi:SAM-dependent methyltransferase
MLDRFRRGLARAIIIDRAASANTSLVGRIARERSEENYRFAGRFAAGKAVVDVGGGTGIGHDLLLAAGALSILSLDRHVTAPQNSRVSALQGDFFTLKLPEAAFDMVICLGTIFYLGNSDAALARMARLLKPGGMLIVNCINPKLVRRYFGMALEEIDEKFSAALSEPELRERLKSHFGAEPEFYVQQPVPVSPPLAFWLTPLTWLFGRHPVGPRPPGTEGMYIYAIVRRNG